MNDLKHPMEYRDKADLFDLACAMVSAGPARDWWDTVSPESLPHGGREPETPQEAEEFFRHTRGLAIKAGVWK